MCTCITGCIISNVKLEFMCVGFMFHHVNHFCDLGLYVSMYMYHSYVVSYGPSIVCSIHMSCDGG